MSSYVDATAGSVEYCSIMSEQFPDLAEQYYNKIATYCQEKLYHQLTMLVLEFVESDVTNTLRPITTTTTTTTTSDGDGEYKNTFLGLYEKVILKVANKINQLSLARIASAVAFSSLHILGSITVQESKQILNDLLKKQQQQQQESSSSAINTTTTATVLYLQSKIGFMTLQTMTGIPTKEELTEIYTTIKTNGPLLNQLIPDTPESIIVNSAHYEMSMTYYKMIGPPELFFNEAIHYLNYYTPTEADVDKSKTLAVDLSLAALTGEGVYNLGQVVNNPIMNILYDTSDKWLIELLTACANGNVQEFKHLYETKYRSEINKQPALVNMSQQMKEKMTLLGLVQLVFDRPSSERTIEFTEIATKLQIPIEDVEWLIMRSFSVKLLQGIMDQVDGTVHVTWILPRVLNNEQMSALATKYSDWSTKVCQTQKYMQK